MIRAGGIDTSPRSALTYTYQPHHDIAGVIVSDGNAKLEGYEKQLEEAGKAPVTLAFHYLRSEISGRKQIDTYLEAIDGFKVDGHIVDFEKRNNTPSYEFGMKAKFWVDEVGVETGQRSLTYSSPSVIQEWMLPYGVDYLKRTNEYFLMIAQYPYKEWNDSLLGVPEGDSWQPRLPAGVLDWKFWQYSAGGNGKAAENGITGNDDVDLLVYNGPLAELKSWLGLVYPKPFFWDIAGHWAENDINKLAAQGVVSGYPDGSFRPDRALSRAEMATLLARIQ